MSISKKILSIFKFIDKVLPYALFLIIGYVLLERVIVDQARISRLETEMSNLYQYINSNIKMKEKAYQESLEQQKVDDQEMKATLENFSKIRDHHDERFAKIDAQNKDHIRMIQEHLNKNKDQ